jgi:hypothetical protein
MNIPVKWTSKYKQNWEEAWKRVNAWWHCEETDRPVVFNSVQKPPSECKGEYISPKNSDEAARLDLDVAVKLNNTRYNLENTFFTAESVPFAGSNFAHLLGLPCVQAGGKLKYDYPNTTWIVEDKDLFDRPLPEVSVPCKELQFVVDLIRYNHENFGYDVVLGATPMLDPMTTLSLMRGQEDFLVDLIEREDEVMNWLKRLGEFHRQAISAFRDARAALGRREDYNWTGAWCPGDMDAVQCDISTMLSPEMFRKFALPEAEYKASFYDYTIWHLDGTDEFRHLDDICGIANLHVIQFVDEKSRDPIEFSHIWEKILKQGKSIMFTCDSKYAPNLAKKFGCRGIAFSFRDALAEQDMDHMLKTLQENSSPKFN